MKFEDLQEGLGVHEAIEAFLDGCNRRDTLFAPEGWRKPYVEALRHLLSQPITKDQSIALRSAALKYHHLDSVIWWLRECPECPWEEYLQNPDRNRHRITHDEHAFDKIALAKGLVTTVGAMGSILACIVMGTIPLLFGKTSLFTGNQIIVLSGIVAIAVVVYFALVFSSARRRSATHVKQKREFMSKKTEKLLAFVFGVVFIVTMLVLAIAFPNPTSFQYTVFRIVLALATGGVAAMIPGFIEVTVSGWLRAGGALAVFAIVYFYNPASLVAANLRPQNATQEDITTEILHQARAYQELSGQYRTVKEQLAQRQNAEAQDKIAKLERELTEVRTGINQKPEALKANPTAYGGVNVSTVSTQAIEAWKSCVNATAAPAGIPVSSGGCYEILKQGLDMTKTTR